MFKTLREAIVNENEKLLKNKMLVSERMAELYKTQKYTDIEFTVGSGNDVKTFKAHKLILAVGSPVFDAMFYGQMQESENTILVPDITPAAFETCLIFLYTDKVELTSVQQVSFVLYAARKYLIQSLEDRCVEYFTQELCPQNLCQIYECALMMDLTKVLDNCTLLFRYNALEILNSENFLNLDVTTVKALIKTPGLDALESNIFKAVHSWGKAECLRKDKEVSKENIRSAILPILSEIWFLRMTPLEFVKNVIETECLLLEESTYILVRLINPDGKETLHWPNHFTLSDKT